MSNLQEHVESGQHDEIRSKTSRRQAIQWFFGLGAGALTLASCGGGGGNDGLPFGPVPTPEPNPSPAPAPAPAPAPLPTPTDDTLPEAPVVRAQNQRVDITLHARESLRQVPVARTAAASYPAAATTLNATLRGFEGRSFGPTLELTGGDLLRVRLINELKANSHQSSLEALNFQNSTNLHFHGLHVDPREVRPGVFGDYVVDTSDAGVRPGQERQHELLIPTDHTPGVHWYHPHLHGSTTVQVASGMFGAILIRHPDDVFAASAKERIIFVHKTFLGPKTTIDGFNDSTSPASDFLLNGAFQPTLVMRPGEVQKWHFINSDIFFPFSPVLDDHTLWSYARDGNVYQGRFRALTPETSGKPTEQNWPGNDIFPGARHSIIIQASRQPGTYMLQNHNPQTGKAEIVARVVIEGTPVEERMPEARELPVFPLAYAPITDEELANAGGRQRHLVLAGLPKSSPLLAAKPVDEQWTASSEDQTPALENTVFATGDYASGTLQLAPYQSVLTPTQTVAFDSVEEWTIYNPNGYAHPFHIHVNDSYVVRINGVPIDPIWADTLPVPTGSIVNNVPKFGTVTFRMRFSDYRGKFVWHCHALDHEDLGMMQLVDIV